MGGLLEPEVERELDGLALDRIAAARAAAVVAAAERVDHDAGEAVVAAQVGVVALLDAVLADPRALLDAAVLVLLELLRRDLAERAEQLRPEVLVRIVAQVLRLDHDAGEALLALLQVAERGTRDVGLDRDVRVRRLGDALDHAPVDGARLDLEHPAELAERAPQVAHLRGDRRDRHRPGLVGGARQPLALAALAPGEAAAALERAQLGGRRQAILLGLRDPLAVDLGGLQLGVGQRGRGDLDDRRLLGLHERRVVAVDDVAARRLDADLAHAVLARLADVVLAGEHLQEPQAEEDDREQHEREAAQDGDADGHLGRDRRAALLRGRRHAGQAFDSGLRPPVVYARRRRRRGSSGRKGSSTRRVRA